MRFRAWLLLMIFIAARFPPAVSQTATQTPEKRESKVLPGHLPFPTGRGAFCDARAARVSPTTGG